MVRRGSVVGRLGWRVLWSSVAFGVGFTSSAGAETLSEALVKAYQSNPQLNAARAQQRATDENVPQALAGYRPQIVASLSAGLQPVRNLLVDNTIQTASLEALDDRPHRYAESLQWLQDRQQRPCCRASGALGSRGVA